MQGVNTVHVRCRSARLQGDIALLGKLHRVAQQVQQYLANARRVTVDPLRHALAPVADQLDTLLLGIGVEDGQAVLKQRLKVKGAEIEINLAGSNFRVIENVVDDIQQVAAGVVDGFDVIALGSIQLRAAHQVGEAK